MRAGLKPVITFARWGEDSGAACDQPTGGSCAQYSGNSPNSPPALPATRISDRYLEAHFKLQLPFQMGTAWQIAQF